MPSRAFLATMGLLAAGAVSAASPVQQQGGAAPRVTAGPQEAAGERVRAGHAIDRWLVSRTLSDAEARDATERLTEYPPVFPQRDAEVAGVRWSLERPGTGTGPAAGPSTDARSSQPGSVGFPATRAGERRLLHSYLRTDRDRTVMLGWRGSECGAAEVWLNGQAILPMGRADTELPAARAASARGETGGARRAAETPIRLAAGWNSLLVSVASEGCPGELAVRLLSAEEVEPGAADPSDIRFQASRPPGIHRTYPAAWVTIGPGVRPGPLTWPAETRELTASVAMELVSWGRDPADPLPELLPEDEEAEEARPRGRIRVRGAPPEEPDPEVPADREDEAPEEVRDEEPERSPAERVEESWAETRQRLAPPPAPGAPAANTVLVEGRAGGARIRTPVETPAPAHPVTFSVPVTFRELQRATAAEGVSLDVRWARERWRGTRSVDADAAEERLGEPIPLTGWVAAAEPDRRAEPAPALPVAAGEPRSSRWQIPAALGGRSLELLTDGAPGRYRVNGEPVSETAGGTGRAVRLSLCDPCREGATLVIQVESTGEWTEFPRAVVAR